MAWTKIPKENHPVFYDVLPDDKRIKSLKMFGGICGTVNGNMFAGLWADSMMVRLNEADCKKVLEMKGARPFDPMGRGKPFKDMVVLPRTIMKQKARLRTWMQKALDYASTLPPKKKKAKKKAR